MHLKIFMWSFVVTAIVAGGRVLLRQLVRRRCSAPILGVLEISLSFDNAVVNATVLERMNDFWQKIFLTVGILIAVFGMRLLFPLVIVWLAAGLRRSRRSTWRWTAAGRRGLLPGRLTELRDLLTDAHPTIAAFGGMFLLMLFLTGSSRSASTPG